MSAPSGSGQPSTDHREVGLVWHERYSFHRTRLLDDPFLEATDHYEHPSTKRRIYSLIGASGLLDHLVAIVPSPAALDQVLAIHDSDYVDRIARESATGGGDGGDEAPFGMGSHDVALLAAGGTIAAVDAVVTGQVQHAYALVRPPGHHAERALGRGFCLYNNAAIAARHAQIAHGAARVAIVDWDVHHGNGTEEAFWTDPTVLTISIHQDRNYPDGGLLEDRGEGDGHGANINVPLPPGSGRGAYLATIDRVVAPALRRFRPGLILVACGFDALGQDPAGRMCLATTVFGELTRAVRDLADEVCDGRLVLTHEGGYSTIAAPYAGLSTIEALSGRTTGVVDPYAEWVEGWAYQGLQTWQSAVIDAAAALAVQVPE